MAEDPSQDGLVSHRNQFPDSIEEDLGGKVVASYATDKTEEEDSMVKTVTEEENEQASKSKIEEEDSLVKTVCMRNPTR